MEKKIAKVNDNIIYQKHLDDMILVYQEQTKKTDISEDEKKNLLDQIINNFILLDEAKSRKVKVDQDILDKHLVEIKKKFKKEEDFIDELKKHGVSLESFQKNIEESLLIQKFSRDEIQDKLKLTADMLEHFYQKNEEKMVIQEMVKAKHIMLSKEKNSSIEKARKKAEELLKELKSGGNFEELAKVNSDCPSAKKGGDLGAFGRGQMVPEFEEIAFSLKLNEISDPVETSFGCHLIKVEEKIPQRKISFKEAQPHIEKIMYQQEGEKIINSLTDELKKTATIEYY